MGNHMNRKPDVGGEANFELPAELLGHPARAAIMLALLDGRALPMTVLAGEAGVAVSTASAHLARLTAGGLLTVTPQGRHRYYSIASPEVAEALEALARLAPPEPVKSFRADRRVRELRAARTCYDHVAGRLGVALMASMLDGGVLHGGDGLHHPDRARLDRLSAPGRDVRYVITSSGKELMTRLGVVVPNSSRPLIRYCIDWTEQRHHLAGSLGAALLARFEELGWVVRGQNSIRRALHVTSDGTEALADWFRIDPSILEQAAAA